MESIDLGTSVKNLEKFLKDVLFDNITGKGYFYPCLGHGYSLVEKKKYRMSEDDELLLDISNFYFIAKKDVLSEDIEKNKILPVISICIPTTLDRFDILKKSLESWSKQKGINKKLVEIILVINGLSFDAEEIQKISELSEFLEKLGLSNHSIVTLKEANLGKARAISVSAARSKILLLVNDDTIASDNLVKKHIETHLSIDAEKLAVVGKFILHPDIPDTRNKKFSKLLDFDQNKIKTGIYKDYSLFTTNNLSVRKEFIYEIGNFSYLFKEAACDDAELGLRFVNSGGSIYFNEEIIAYHYHPNYFSNIKKVYEKRGYWYAVLRYKAQSLKEEEDLINIPLVKSLLEELTEEIKVLTMILDNDLIEDLINDFNIYEFLKGSYKSYDYLLYYKQREKFLKAQHYPLVSVVIPAFNAEKYLKDSVLSVVEQTYPNIEIIIVDNNSTDKTFQIAKELSVRYDNIQVISEKEQGQGAARNAGARIAQGKYLMFLDADDLLFPYSVKLQVATALIESSDFVYGNYILTDENKTKFRLFRMLNISHFDIREKILIQIGGNVFPIGSVLISKKLFEDIGGFDNKLSPAEDFDLWNRILLKGVKISKSHLPVYLYRQHSNQSTKDFLQFSKKVDEALIKFWNLLKQRNPQIIDITFLVKAIEKAFSRQEEIPKYTALLIKELENTKSHMQKEVKHLTKLYMRRYGRKL